MDPKVFSGFFYIEGDATYGKIDNSFRFKKDISEFGNDDINVTFIDVLNKYTDPVQLNRTDGTVTQKFIVENGSLQGTLDDRDQIDTSTLDWRRIFFLSHYIYYNGPTNKTRDEINGVFKGTEIDPSITDTTMFNGYIGDSLNIVKNSIGSGLEYFTFRYRVNSDTIYDIIMYVSPQAFVEDWSSPNPAIYVYYTEDDSISVEEQGTILTDISTNIGPAYMNNYTSILVPLYTTDINADKMRIHIWTKSYPIPSNPVEDEYILSNIRSKIRLQEPSLTPAQLISKYPTLFVEEIRTVWCMFNNKTLANLTIPNPVNPGQFMQYAGSPISLNDINNTIAAVDQLRINMNMWEITTIDGDNRWFPIIISGSYGGALTDKFPKYKPVYSDIDDTTSDGINARQFYMYLDKVINYILGIIQVLTPTEITTMGIGETSEYVEFTSSGCKWKVYKQGFKTSADQP